MRIGQGLWEMETAGWSIEHESPCLTLRPADVEAALQISTYRKVADAITQDELLTQLRTSVPDDLDLEPVVYGQFNGWTCEFFDDEGNFWRYWNLGRGQTNLFITYVCANDHRGDHWKVVDWMLSTLDVESRYDRDRATIRGSEFYAEFNGNHPEVDLLPDSSLKDSWYHCWITSRDGSAVHILSYVRAKSGQMQAQKYNSEGNTFWADVR